MRGRERRFQADVNHGIAKAVVNSDSDVIAIEDLHIERTKDVGRRFNHHLGGWAFAQLGSFLRYKAEELGKRVVLVPPEYTSKMCSRCGNLGVRKRHEFHCPVCGLRLNADLNGARNIAHLGSALAGRPIVNGPIVAGNDAEHGISVEPSYKPPISMGGS
jgi:IS605 OrfB family transposase